MIQPQELRVGNIVLENNGNYICEFVIAAINSLTGTAIDKNDNITSIEYLEPIPLIPEWFTKLGFEGEHIFLKRDLSIQMYYDAGHYGGGWKLTLFNRNMKGLKYVHQLQNLYFALTGEELTIKET